jgi:hypothetical protein
MAEKECEKEKRREEPSIEELAEDYFGRVMDVVPGDFRKHMRLARKELLLAARSLLDAHIEAMDERERRTASKRPTRVKID